MTTIFIGGLDISPMDGDHSDQCIVGYTVYAYKGPRLPLELKYQKVIRNSFGIAYCPGKVFIGLNF